MLLRYKKKLSSQLFKNDIKQELAHHRPIVLCCGIASPSGPPAPPRTINCVLRLTEWSLFCKVSHGMMGKGKDITHKLYSLNEHLDTSKNGEGRSNLGCHSDYWKTMNRSLSVDAVHTGTQGHVRSLVWRTQNQRRASITNSDRSSPEKNQQFHYWVPVIADQFPATSPFTTYSHTVTAAPTSTTPQVLGSQPPISQLQSSFHNSAEREEKFETPV
uniref:Uncharacterized protein n=2 Tax=Timema TaxID=61471 RepID=A0A7R9IGN4_9NEOP|nr:unnamed protein product [Timema tahoe]